MKKNILFLICSFYSFCILAGEFDINKNIEIAYKQAMSLKLKKAQKSIQLEKNQNPDNLMIVVLENYIDFFTVFINEDEKEFEELVKNKTIRIEKIKAEGNPDSPYYKYFQAEIMLQWAICRLKFEQYVAAAKEVRKAYKLLDANTKEHPEFIASYKSRGMLKAMVGTIPDGYKWAASLMGLKGTINEGMGDVKMVLDYASTNDFLFEEETLVMYAFLLLHLGNQEKNAWDLLNNAKLKPAENPLHCFVLANVAMHSGKNDKAIKLLKAAPRNQEFHPFHYLDYMLGNCKLRRLDKDASVPLRKYCAAFKGQNFIKDAWFKIAWSEFLNGNAVEYKSALAKCLTEGAAVSDEDKKAAKFAATNSVPNAYLLRARLSFDGAYYAKAFDILKGKSKEQFQRRSDQLELTYRLGRITHAQNNYELAISYYEQTISDGRFDSYYFACNAALQAGLIRETQKNYSEAKKYFKTCLSIKPEEYKNSLHQKAKAALNRLN